MKYILFILMAASLSACAKDLSNQVPLSAPADYIVNSANPGECENLAEIFRRWGQLAEAQDQIAQQINPITVSRASYSLDVYCQAYFLSIRHR